MTKDREPKFSRQDRVVFDGVVYALGSELRREFFFHEDLALRQVRGIPWAFAIVLASIPARIRARLATSQFFFDRAHADLLIEAVESLAVFMAMFELDDDEAAIDAMDIANDKIQRAAAMELSASHLSKIRPNAEERTRNLWRA